VVAFPLRQQKKPGAGPGFRSSLVEASSTLWQLS
jgi:hypothetical protein